VNSDDSVIGVERFLKIAREVIDPKQIRCPYCGMREFPFQHYRYCTMGEEMDRLGYVVGWMERTKYED